MRFQKISIAARLRIAVMVILGLLFAAAVYYTATVFRRPALVENKVTGLTYRQKGTLNYSVKIKPNSVFPEERLGPGRTYFTKLVEAIDAKFIYILKTDRSANLKATYSVVAAVEAPKMWQKEFTLVPATEVAAKGDRLSIDKPFTIDLSFFNNFLKGVNEEVGATASEPRLVIKAPVDIKVISGNGVVTDRLAPTMIIPLATGCFKVSGELSPEKNGELTVLRKVSDPLLGSMKKRAVVFLVGAGIMLLLWPLATRGDGNKAVAGGKRELDLLARMYGDKIIEVEPGFSLPDGVVIVPLDSAEDLVKVADELGKPVIFQHCSSPDRPCYLVLDGIIAYRYLLTDWKDFRRVEAGGRKVKRTLGHGASFQVSRG